jgi:rhomboid protease GluP
MIPRARRLRWRWMLNVGACLTIGLIPFGLIGGIVIGINEQRGDSAISGETFVGILTLLGGLGVALISCKFLSDRWYDPNAQDVEAHKRLGQSRATLLPEDPASPAPAPPDGGTGRAAGNAAPPPAPDLPVLLAFERRLRAATPWTPVTAAVAAANVAVFAVMAFRYHQLVELNAHILMGWGAAYAPRTFGGQWWRLATAMFLHGGLGHLAANLCFLLLIAPLVERLLGPVRFAVVYLFAGLGAGLLATGWFPAGVAVGASGAVNGVYGAFLGCYLRGPRTIPLRIFGRHVGVLLLYTGVSLWLEYLDQEHSLIAHLGGLLFGFTGGLLFGHVLRPRPAWGRACHTALATAACAALIGVTAWGVLKCTRKPVQILARYDAARERERALSGRFADGLRRWEDGGMSDAALRGLLQGQLIPEWERARTDLGLRLPPELADMERQRLSMRDLFPKGRPSDPGRGRGPKAGGAPTEKEYDETYRLYLKIRADNWRALADGLQGDPSQMAEPLVDMLFLAILRKGLDDRVNEDNPLQQWLELSRRKTR